MCARNSSSASTCAIPDLCIDQISAELGCSKRYLHMLFSERGTTVSDYIWQARLQNCRQELEAHAGKTITDVAFSWGFSSSSHFSRVFRKYFGVVPSSIHKAQQGAVAVGRELDAGRAFACRLRRGPERPVSPHGMSQPIVRHCGCMREQAGSRMRRGRSPLNDLLQTSPRIAGSRGGR